MRAENLNHKERLSLDPVGGAIHFVGQRAIQAREIRRVGENKNQRVDLRIVAATHRELENTMERAVALAPGTRVELEDLPKEIRHGFPAPLATAGTVRQGPTTSLRATV